MLTTIAIFGVPLKLIESGTAKKSHGQGFNVSKYESNEKHMYAASDVCPLSLLLFHRALKDDAVCIFVCS